MDKNRRKLLTAAVSAALLQIFPGTRVYAENLEPISGDEISPINVILPRNYSPPHVKDDPDFCSKLSAATLDFLYDHYKNQPLPIWKHPYERAVFEPRIKNIIHWIVQGVEKHKDIYPVDPAWVIAQIMTESYFHEFAVSYAFAVGVCQFIPSTARMYGMRLAGDSPSHTKPPYKNTEYAGMLEEYYKTRKKLAGLNRRYRKFYRNKSKHIKELLEAYVSGTKAPDAEEHLWYIYEREELEKSMKVSAQGYKEFLEANFEGRDIFNNNDLAFLLSFDERVAYRKSVQSMVLMLARALRARNGNILAAAAGYNAGLSSTRDHGLYEPFGRIPNYEQTATYVSRVAINHYAIVRRMS